MKLLGDVSHVESRFGPFGDCVSVSYYVTRHKCKLILVRLEIVLILIQDRCMVRAERTIGSKIIGDTPDGTPR
jgi:hypothetical protein